MTTPHQAIPGYSKSWQTARYKFSFAKFLGCVCAALLLIGAPHAAAQAGDLESVLSAMDQAAATFRSAQVDLTADVYESVVKEHTYQGGLMYISKAGKNGNDVRMYADFNQPENQKKQVLFKNNKLELYNPITKTSNVYDTEKNKEAVQSFLVLGFGSPGHDLARQFQVKYAGPEVVAGIKAAKLELTPKSERVRNMFNTIVLWIDMNSNSPTRGLSVQQKFIDLDGNYRLVTYSNMRINTKLPHNIFEIKK
jgi:outer membrane lipoprotein-sorting protein